MTHRDIWILSDSLIFFSAFHIFYSHFEFKVYFFMFKKYTFLHALMQLLFFCTGELCTNTIGNNLTKFLLLILLYYLPIWIQVWKILYFWYQYQFFYLLYFCSYLKTATLLCTYINIMHIKFTNCTLCPLGHLLKINN